MKQILKRICFFSFCLLFCGLQSDVASGQELDDVLSGFDTETVEQEKEPAAGDMDDLLSGFDEPIAEQLEKDAPDARVIPEWMQLTGSVGLAGSVNFAHDAPQENEADFRGLSMLLTIN